MLLLEMPYEKAKRVQKFIACWSQVVGVAGGAPCVQLTCVISTESKLINKIIVKNNVMNDGVF